MYVIEINELPPSLNQYYAGKHWSWRKRLTDEWRLRLLAAYREAKLPKPLKWPVTLSVTQYCKGVVRDADNAVIAAKFAGDTLVQHGWLPDDGPTYIPTVILSTEKGASNKTIIQIL